MAKSKGKTNWVALNRSILDSDLWTNSEPFDYRSAWVDLILLANHKEGVFITSRHEVIKIPRGAHFTSLRSLANRWHWDRATVKRYLNLLESQEMVTQTVTHSGTLLSLVNYDVYQSRPDARSAADSATDSDADSDADSARTINKEEYKKRRSSTHRPTLQERYEAMKRIAAEGDAKERAEDEQRRSNQTV